VIPAVSIGFVSLIVPLSHAGSPLPASHAPTTQDVAVRAAIGVLRTEAGKGIARIGSSPSAAALLEFYRARYRQREWRTEDAQADYFLWVTPDPPPSGPHREALFQQDGVVLFR
jgi:hypothetical protein